MRMQATLKARSIGYEMVMKKPLERFPIGLLIQIPPLFSMLKLSSRVAACSAILIALVLLGRLRNKDLPTRLNEKMKR